MDDQLYKQYILDFYRNPLNKGKLDPCDLHASGTNQTCGDKIEITIRLDKDRRIVEIKHMGVGCAISQASISLLTDKVKGMLVDEINTMKKEEAIALLNVPISHTREKCATLGWIILQKAVANNL